MCGPVATIIYLFGSSERISCHVGGNAGECLLHPGIGLLRKDSILTVVRGRNALLGFPRMQVVQQITGKYGPDDGDKSRPQNGGVIITF
jgi:hypothetical protein